MVNQLRFAFMLTTFFFISDLFAQENDTIKRQRQTILEIGTGLNSNGLPHFLDINLMFQKNKVSCLGLGYSQYRLPDDPNKNLVKLKFRMESLLIQKQFDLGLHLDFGITKTYNKNESYGIDLTIGVLALMPLTKNFNLMINPFMGFNGNPDDESPQGIFGFNIGLRHQTQLFSTKAKSSENFHKNSGFGLALGISVNTLSRIIPRYGFSEQVPLYKNSLYFLKRTNSIISFLYKSQSSNIQTLSLIFNDYTDVHNWDNGGQAPTVTKIYDFTLSYKMEIPLIKSEKMKLHTIFYPFIGGGAAYIHKSYHIHKNYDSFNTNNYDIWKHNKSDVVFFNLIPGFKRFKYNIFYEASLNLNVLGFTTGHYNTKITETIQQPYSIVKSTNSQDYSTWLTPSEIFKQRYFFNNICFKIGYVF